MGLCVACMNQATPAGQAVVLPEAPISQAAGRYHVPADTPPDVLPLQAFAALVDPVQSMLVKQGEGARQWRAGRPWLPRHSINPVLNSASPRSCSSASKRSAAGDR